MKLKKEYLILLLVIAALSLYLAMRSRDQTHFELPELAEVESKTVNRLVITKAGAVIELNKRDDRWYVAPQDYPADSIKVNNMVKAAADLTVTALVSESESYQRYGLDAEQKTNLQALADKKVLRNVDIGRLAPTGQHTFVKLPDDAKVYHARGSINRTFDQTVADLRDATVLNYEKDTITALTIQKGEHTLALHKKETPPDAPKEGEPQTTATPAEPQWLDADGQAADAEAVKKLVNNFANVKGNGYMADDARQGLHDALWTVSFKAGEQTHSLSLFAPPTADADEFPATSSDNDYAFLLFKSRVETFEKQIDTLLKIEPPAQSQDS